MSCVQPITELEASFPLLVGVQAIRTEMNATRPKIETLRDHGILQLRFPNLRLKSPWVIENVFALVRELADLAVSFPVDAEGWETLQFVENRDDKWRALEDSNPRPEN